MANLRSTIRQSLTIQSVVIVFLLNGALTIAHGQTGPAADTLESAASDESASDESASVDHAAHIVTLIRGLGSRSFDARQQATRDLERVGGTAIPALEEASLSKNREIRTRTLGLLKGHLRGIDPNYAVQAEEALTRLAADPSHPSGRLAANILSDPLAKVRDHLVQTAQLMEQLKVRNIQFRRAAPPVRVLPIRRQLNLGVTSSISIADNMNGKLTIEIVNGKVQKMAVELPDGTKKNYDDLKTVKEKHPKLFERYEQIARANGYPLPKEKGDKLGPEN
jgi:hypothetical protein